MCNFYNQIIANTVRIQHYKCYTVIVVGLDVTETTDRHWKAVSLLSTRLKFPVYFEYYSAELYTATTLSFNGTMAYRVALKTEYRLHGQNF